jgi:hypothetical protein
MRLSNTCSIYAMLLGMAGGMGRRSDRPSLAERSAASRVDRPPAGKHCWVVDAPGAPGRWPGLLIEWRRSETGWEGRVTYTTMFGDRFLLIEQWLASAFLESP